MRRLLDIRKRQTIRAIRRTLLGAGLLAITPFAAGLAQPTVGAPAPAPTAAAPSLPASQETVTLDLRDVPITKVLEIFTEQTKINFVASQEVAGTVTVKLDRVPWEQALGAVLRTRGLAFERVANMVHVDKAERFAKEPESRVFQLDHLASSEVQGMVKGLLSKSGQLHVLERAGAAGTPGGTLVVSDTPDVLGRVEALLKLVDVPSRAESLQIAGPGPSGRYSADIRNVTFKRVFDALRRRFGINIVEDSPIEGRLSIQLEGLEKNDLIGEILGAHPIRFLRDGETYRVAEEKQFRDRVVTRVFELLYSDAEDVRRFVEAHLSPLGKVEVFARRSRTQFAYGSSQTGSGSASGRGGAGGQSAQNLSRRQAVQSTVPDRSNVIAVTDTQAAIENISALITRLDVRPRQVSIDVKIVEVTLEKGDTLGIDWNVNMSYTGGSKPTNFPFGGNGPSTSRANDTLRFGTISAQAFTGVLRALEQRNKLKILSSPRISTLNNQEASILIGEKFPITVETIDPLTAVRTVTLDHYEQIGVQLLVVPQISGEDSVNLIIHPAVSSVGSLIQEQFPVIATREADTQILVRNSDTAVIGGLLQERLTQRKTRVPGVSEIPLLGKLFRSEEEENVTVDLLIFVTPTIVPDGFDVRQAPLPGSVSRPMLYQRRDPNRRSTRTSASPVRSSEIPVRITEIPVQSTEIPVEAGAASVQAPKTPAQASEIPVQASEDSVQAELVEAPVSGASQTGGSSVIAAMTRVPDVTRPATSESSSAPAVETEQPESEPRVPRSEAASSAPEKPQLTDPGLSPAKRVVQLLQGKGFRSRRALSPIAMDRKASSGRSARDRGGVTVE